MMKHVILISLMFIVGCGSALADVTGIWQDPDGNYFSVQRNDGKVLILDLSHSLPRATSLKNLAVEQKPEYLAYFGEVSQEDFDSGDFYIPPLILLKSIYPEAQTITDATLIFSTTNIDKTQANITDICDACSGGVYSFSVMLTKVF